MLRTLPAQIQEVVEFLNSSHAKADRVTESVEIVSQLSDFPKPDESGAITLLANKTYFITKHVDLGGARLIGSPNTVILGHSSENCSLTSTGLTGNPLIFTQYSMPMRFIAIKDVEVGFEADQDTQPNPLALDWAGVNFSNCDVSVRLGKVTNFIYQVGAFLSTGGIEFHGEVGTIGFGDSIFIGTGDAYSLIDVKSTATITRRLRMSACSIIAFGSTVGITIDPAATIPNESFILNNVNFSGGGTYLAGVTSTDDKSLFFQCVGIPNTASTGEYYMQGNAVATVLSDTTTFVKILGTTIGTAINQRFSHSNNRLTSTGPIANRYRVVCECSFTTGANRVIELGIFDSGLGAVNAASVSASTSNGSGRSENVSLSAIIDMSTSDYIEVHLRNTSDTTDVTVTSIHVTITPL